MDALLLCCAVMVLVVAEDGSLSVCFVKCVMGGRRNTEDGVCKVVFNTTSDPQAQGR